jgi:hypothetical protein
MADAYFFRYLHPYRVSQPRPKAARAIRNVCESRLQFVRPKISATQRGESASVDLSAEVIESVDYLAATLLRVIDDDVVSLFGG